MATDKDQKTNELSDENLDQASGGAGFMYFKDSPIVGDGREAGPTDVVSKDDGTSEDQAIGSANGGVWKTTDGGLTS